MGPLRHKTAEFASSSASKVILLELESGRNGVEQAGHASCGRRRKKAGNQPLIGVFPRYFCSACIWSCGRWLAETTIDWFYEFCGLPSHFLLLDKNKNLKTPGSFTDVQRIVAQIPVVILFSFEFSSLILVALLFLIVIWLFFDKGRLVERLFWCLLFVTHTCCSIVHIRPTLPSWKLWVVAQEW